MFRAPRDCQTSDCTRYGEKAGELKEKQKMYSTELPFLLTTVSHAAPHISKCLIYPPASKGRCEGDSESECSDCWKLCLGTSFLEIQLAGISRSLPRTCREEPAKVQRARAQDCCSEGAVTDGWQARGDIPSAPAGSPWHLLRDSRKARTEMTKH